MGTLALPIVTRVTTGAIRLVLAAAPAHCLAVAPVTTRAGRVGSMVARIVSGRVVVCSGRYPGVRAVAFIALHRGHKVVGRFSRCADTVVTAGAGTAQAVVVHSGRYPGLRGVAVITLGRGLDVSGRLSGCGGPVVAR